MVISKVLNNNVVVALNRKQEEIILMGNGLGFQKKAGDKVEPCKIEKTYTIDDTESVERIEELFKGISEEIIELTIELLSYAKQVLNKELNGLAFMAIADHLQVAIQRVEQEIFVKNFLLWDIKRFYPTEFNVSKEFLLLVKERLGVDLSEDEAGFLTLHIVNAGMDNDSEDAIQLTQLIEEILTVIKYTLHINFNDDDIYFQRFITHLKFFSKKVLTHQSMILTEREIDHDLFFLVNEKYPEACEATKKVMELLKERWSYHLSEDEQVYITIHLARILQKTMKEN
ncbi:PRD domain-containing protein [Enterococcus ratti]|uniref:BglG family transcription antiterminator LicT n=1 Tax=Enterococcus ratti TaxID=150033 RepID=UPI0035139747